MLRNLCEEEIDGTAHSELWLNFAEGMGAVREEVKARQPIPEFSSLADMFRRLASFGNDLFKTPSDTVG